MKARGQMCSTFQLLAERTWSGVGRNFSTPIWAREDAFTALNLQDLYELHSSELRVIPFSPHYESRVSGADWEWWFVQPGAVYGAAVQSKLLKSDGTYDVGYVPRNSNVPQIERLLQYCRRFGDVEPLYCFYNNFSPFFMSPEWPCPSFSRRDELYGCALANGARVWEAHQRSQYSLQVLKEMMIPWHCITCCPGGGKPDGSATRAQFTATRLRRGLDEERRAATELPEGFGEVLPRRVRILLELVDQEEDTDALLGELWDGTPPNFVVVQGTMEELNVG